MNERKGNFDCINFIASIRQATNDANGKPYARVVVKCPYCPVAVAAETNHRGEVYSVSTNQICTTPVEEGTDETGVENN